MTPTDNAHLPSAVAVCVIVHEGEANLVPELLADLSRQTGVGFETILVDLTLAADLAVADTPEVTIVRSTPGSRGEAYRRALEATDAPLIAWQLPGARSWPTRLARLAASLDKNPEADFAISDLLVRGADGAERRVDFEGGDPGSCWETSVVLRREALAEIDPASFSPAEFGLFKKRLGAGRVVHVRDPLSIVDAELHESRRERSSHDAQLVALAENPHVGLPEVTVLLATHKRCDVFLECIEGFARQLVPPGTIEIVVIDDGSDDQTPEVGPALAPSCSYTFLRQFPADGASRARILGLPHATGRLILFVNDDTLPFPDCIERHVQAHASYGARQVTVLGTFEQPKEHLENALMEMLEETLFVFGYHDLEPGQELDASYFYTCHVSVPLQAVLDAGGFDPDFSHYGCEDTDLGMQLERAGVSIVYRPECRAIHRHFLPFENIQRRQRVVALAHVRLFKKYPELLEKCPWWANLTREELVRRNEGVLPHLHTIEAACRSLAGVNLAKLKGSDGPAGHTAKRVAELLGELFPKLNKVWWDLGFLAGFEEHGLDGFPELAAGSTEMTQMEAA